MLGRPSQQVHLTQYFYKWFAFKVICQTTAYCLKIIQYQRRRDIRNLNPLISSFIKRRSISHLPEFVKHLAFCLNGTCSAADIPFAWRLFCRNSLSYIIRAVNPGRSPYHKNTLPINFLHINTRHIVRFYLVIVPNHVLLYIVQCLNRHTCNRSFGNSCPFLFLYPHHDISTANVVKIIGKSTDCPIDFIRIPSFLKLNAVGFYLALVKQVFYVNWYCHAIGDRLNYFSFLHKATPSHPHSGLQRCETMFRDLAAMCLYTNETQNKYFYQSARTAILPSCFVQQVLPLFYLVASYRKDL